MKNESAMNCETVEHSIEREGTLSTDDHPVTPVLKGVEGHRAVYGEIYDYVENYQRKYSAPRNIGRGIGATAVTALVSVADFQAFTAGSVYAATATLGTLSLGALMLYWLKDMKHRRDTNSNCMLVRNFHHNEVIDYINESSSLSIKHNSEIPLCLLEKVKAKPLKEYVTNRLIVAQKNHAAGERPAIVPKRARPNCEGRQKIYPQYGKNHK